MRLPDCSSLRQLGQRPQSSRALDRGRTKISTGFGLGFNARRGKGESRSDFDFNGPHRRGAGFDGRGVGQRTQRPSHCQSIPLCGAIECKPKPRQLFAGHSRWPAILDHKRSQYRNARDPERKLRVGYVSSDFRYHSCACFMLPLFDSHNRETFEVIAHSTATTADDITQKFKDSADHWRDCFSLGDDELIQRILTDEIDLLVDCSGHTKGNRLRIFQYKPAPIQMTWLGYPSTTGLKAIDYRLSDVVTDPVGEADQLHSETVLRLDAGFHTYRPLAQTPGPSPVPSTRSGRIHFGAFQNLSKVSDKTIELWALVLGAVPNGRLIMKARGLDERAVAERTRKRLTGLGISQDQFEFVPWNAIYGQHFRDFERVDIVLDTTPYNGTTTTCEALWMGAPVVTLSGDRSASRVGASLLNQIGHQEWIAHSDAEFVQIAASLASDTGQLAKLRKSLRTELCHSSLGDSDLFARSLESAYREVWRQWCATSSTR